MKIFTLALLSVSLFLPVDAQVRPEYLYNTNMPYGTLDIRTNISETKFYYLEEGKTFSFRESPPGTRTNRFHDMTSWDSSPYTEGHLRKKDEDKDNFIMNYRLLPPLNYNSTYAPGYPLIVLMHGAVERGNCFYAECYHADFSYDPNVNIPPAPSTPTHRLLNNDDHLTIGAEQHMVARDLAGGRLPDDGTMPSRAFPGFTLVPQMLNVWDSVVVEDVIRMVMLHCEKYNIDQNRIYIHGLSIGGYATYEAVKRAPWLFAAALPMSAVTEAGNIFKHGQQDNVAHVPIWMFQGGVDKRPSPEFTRALIKKFRSAGTSVKYTVYPELNHIVWDKAYAEPEFFSWMLGKSKTKIHPRGGITQIDTISNLYPTLMLAGGFFAYQWEKDGTIIPGAKSNTLTVDGPGVYRARFSRISPTPAAPDWNDWSPLVTVKEGGPVVGVEKENSFEISVYPNPTQGRDLNIRLSSFAGQDLSIEVVDMFGHILYETKYRATELVEDQDVSVSLPSLAEGVYILILKNGGQEERRRVVVN